jgi:hypothetical protein
LTISETEIGEFRSQGSAPIAMSLLSDERG